MMVPVVFPRPVDGRAEPSPTAAQQRLLVGLTTLLVVLVAAAALYVIGG